MVAAAKLLQSCLTLCDPIDISPPGSPHPWDSPGKNTGVGCHFLLQCMKMKSESEVIRLCPMFPDPMDCSLPGSSIHGIFQARILEWVVIAFSMIYGSVQFSSVQSLSRVRLFATPWIAACQASLSITNSWSLLKHMSIKSVMPSSHPAISSSVIPFSSCPQSLKHQGLFQWVNSSHEVAKVLKFQLQHQSFHWTPRTDFL